ncbi:MAG: hypothetical protein QOJ23_4255 [Actinomycetota bacterium]|jgi:hypothetical protein|nr:hypothetical protein [Actinomycetota bacterium]
MNDHAGPDWVDDAARRIRARLAAVTERGAIGHVDWEAHNLDWADGVPTMVHDWDSLAIRPEPAIAGAAATVYPSVAGGAVAATIDQTTAFLDAYHYHRPEWSGADVEDAWAAGLWVLLYNAKKESLGGGTGYLKHLERDLDQRLRHAGL